jgi:hypothetical protein
MTLRIRRRLRTALAIAAAAIAAVVVIRILVVGAIDTAGAFAILAHRLHPSWNSGPLFDWIQDLYSEKRSGGTRVFLGDRTDALITAVATLFLWWATRALGRSTRQQAAGAAPLLRIALTADPRRHAAGPVSPATAVALVAPVPRAPDPHHPYDEELRNEDAAWYQDRSFFPEAPDRFVYLEITNAQTAPFAVARDVEIALRFQGMGERSVSVANEARVETLTFQAERVASVTLLAPGETRLIPILNVGPVRSFDVRVTDDVSYKDLRGDRSRRATYGDLGLIESPDGSCEAEDGYIEPKGWEAP